MSLRPLMIAGHKRAVSITTAAVSQWVFSIGRVQAFQISVRSLNITVLCDSVRLLPHLLHNRNQKRAKSIRPRREPTLALYILPGAACGEHFVGGSRAVIKRFFKKRDAA